MPPEYDPTWLESMRQRWAGRDWLEPFDEQGRLLHFGVLPTPMLLGHDSRFAGRGVTLAMVDSGFFPHPDIAIGRAGANRVRAWADCCAPRIRRRFFDRNEPPRWPAWNRRAASQWHGTMTAAVAASSNSIYRGLAPEAELVLVQTWDADGRITNASIARALRWLFVNREHLKLRIVNLAVGGDPMRRVEGNFVDRAVQQLVDAGIVVIAAAGNSGIERLLPPATAAGAIAVGGLETRNSPDHAIWRMWHSNWGISWAGVSKPDLIAPSRWLAAPVLPGSAVAAEAEELFSRRSRDSDAEKRIAELKLLSPHFQHVDGTSFAASITAGVVACMLEAAPGLKPEQVRTALTSSARLLPDVPNARQGAGAVQPADAVKHALRIGTR